MNKVHFHECPDCDEVWECTSHDCAGSCEYQCNECFKQLKLIEFEE